MSSLETTSLKIVNYRCFKDIPVGFDRIKPVNLIIGRNNSGKSTLLDVVRLSTNPKEYMNDDATRNSQLEISVKLNEQLIKSIIDGSPGNGRWIDFINHSMGPSVHTTAQSFALHYFNGRTFTWRQYQNKTTQKVDISKFIDGIKNPSNISDVATIIFTEFLKDIVNVNPFLDKVFVRLGPDRDIKSEPINDANNYVIDANGNGCTNAVNAFLNNRTLEDKHVEETILDELNMILGPDGNIKKIKTKQQGNQYEIFLEEEGKDRVPLSNTGHGIKTILLVLCQMYLTPEIKLRMNKDWDISKFFFAFEELENNLHPALLRRLLSFIEKRAVATGCKVFLTSHSSVAIDLFATSEHAQILHITHSNGESKAQVTNTAIHHRDILDDLDIRASDLLQANGIVWVEGPTDRIYFNKWMKLFSGGDLREGSHYQCVFYGGRLLSHLSAIDEGYVNEEYHQEELIRILKVNRNAILIADRDRGNGMAPINQTKQRLVDEISQEGGIAWVTAGREIENYIPSSAIQSLYSLGEIVSQVGRFDKFADYLSGVSSEAHEEYAKKMVFAERIQDHLTLENLSPVLDLKEQMKNVCELIKRWNGR